MFSFLCYKTRGFRGFYTNPSQTSCPRKDDKSVLQRFRVKEWTVTNHRWIRQRGEDGHFIYFKTRKKKLSDMKRVEEERRLSQDEYLALLMTADPAFRPIRKQRWCLSENGMYYEIDIYPEWNDRAMMEIELDKEDRPIIIPDCIEVIQEVTGMKEYSNHELARIKR